MRISRIQHSILDILNIQDDLSTKELAERIERRGGVFKGHKRWFVPVTRKACEILCRNGFIGKHLSKHKLYPWTSQTVWFTLDGKK